MWVYLKSWLNRSLFLKFDSFQANSLAEMTFKINVVTPAEVSFVVKFKVTPSDQLKKYK